MTKEVNYHVWEDDSLEANYYSNIQLPNGGQVYACIGKTTIEKGDVVYLDYGRSLMEYTRSGKGYAAEFPFGKIHLHGVPCSVILDKTHEVRFTKSSEKEFNELIKKQKERIDKFIPQMKEIFISKYMTQLEINKENHNSIENQRKVKVIHALEQMEAFFKKPKL